ncbi:4Fe-4S ferredoxin iron-sulfur binding domain protein [Methanosalsum zhilinae DSM 4017]|uniref:4Fe-4S ferredoxin iron-sulfur binding domain protein n=1 Tax=Methanosalsum zhilinae (strain DSM 4017 / NBRC 107636 / OCM 62 / WeN5) TaxID=679901 RepID=F7XKS8_METZD|nr:methylamine methyltransferase corrinoid protein reductive activase [Methanosalsum zhilinae]AEH61791.1 4Fe-4S ferredoxin iron-sulfur binding domain protein [Methanosalsum zhilinae DSM 4017]
MKQGIAIDLGTSGFRAQRIDLESGNIGKTVISLRNPLPGANVMDHLDFAVNYGQDIAHELVINAFKNISDMLRTDQSSIDRIAVCGNPIQLSLFQGIPVEDLAYAGERKKKKLNIKEQERKAAIISSSDIPGLEDFGDCQVMIPPAIKHEVGADALALIVKSGMLDSDDISIATDYGTNAEMALKVDNVIYTGSAAAGPALEGQQIRDGILASPNAISDVKFENDSLRNYVLDDELTAVEGDLVDPKSGEVVQKGDIRAKGITGTGVIALIEQSMGKGLIQLPRINTTDKILHLQDNIRFSEKDLIEAGRAIGAIRAGHITLCNVAGIEMQDIKTAYMSGAAGTYMDAVKAHRIGMIPFGVNDVYQIGNTSLTLAREILLSEDRLWELQDISQKIVGNHVMFAMDKAFQDTYVLELAYWGEGMPFKMFKKYLKKKNLSNLDEPAKAPQVSKLVERDIADLGDEGLSVIERVGTYLTMKIEDCEECRKCILVCPNDAIEMDEEGVVLIRTDLCDGSNCQKCIRACPPEKFRWENLVVAKV